MNFSTNDFREDLRTIRDELWQYEAGIYTHMGLGHAGAVTCCRFSPDSRHVVSCCAAGSIIVWKVPQQYLNKINAPLVSPKPEPNQASQPTEQDLKLHLDDKPKRGAGDRPNRVPAAPNKIEKISAMNTARESMMSCCPCEADGKKKPTPVNSQRSTGNSKGSKSPANLPTKTTSKEFVNGSGDKK